MMVSYNPNKGKIVLFLSSKHNRPEIAEDKKPKIIHYYNKTKGGVDLLDMMCGRYSCSKKTQRWPLFLFYGVLNIVVTIAFILCNMIKGIKVRRTFMHNLAEELVRPWAERRLQQRGMKSSVMNVIRSCFNISHDRPQDRPAATDRHAKRRCCFCPWKTAKQTRTVCANCNKHVCPVHSDVLCNVCQQ
ncbi:hypothetical protein Pmani_004247 [Petrolisthes manimaculis]|uniref:PiggyBac transposable element-derived protein domain-containing protein n=1 Tax=Petrolisthes manimaculis TaxID=1843537 RepID=A0AAE1QEX5_9EUCA|nr:hypothetical protein Pmani_004247 [Petrolisthes manimaculis]